MQELTDKEARELWALLHLREALGDPTGKLMQDELVERARQAWKDAERYRWLKTQFRVMSLNMSGNHVWVQASSGAWLLRQGVFRGSAAVGFDAEGVGVESN